MIMYVVGARSIREHNDAWLHGEVEVLRQVSLATPQGRVYPRVIRAIAESATEEVTGASHTRAERVEMIFFLHLDETGRDLIWLGPGPSTAFITTVREAHLSTGIPESVRVPGHRFPFRVVQAPVLHGTAIYLGLSDVHALHLLQHLVWRLGWIWFGVVCTGWIVSFGVARRTLSRVDSITEAAGRIRSDDLSTRIPTGSHTDEIARLARTLNRMLDRVAESVSQLRSVTDTVAHELKSPVTSIHGRLEVALSSHDSPRLREAAELSIEDLDRLANFITTTLDVAEADAGGLRIRPEVVDFSDLVSKLLSLYEPAFTERHLALVAHVADHHLVCVDVSLMTRALGNLLDNELNHTRPDATVMVTTRAEPSGVRLRIEDDGPGFPPGVETHLFRRFTKGGPSGGHGLGLAFVRAIVTAHGGYVTGGNRPEGGMYVDITLATAQGTSTG